MSSLNIKKESTTKNTKLIVSSIDYFDIHTTPDNYMIPAVINIRNKHHKHKSHRKHYK